MEFYSQIGQDRFLFEHFFRGRRGGVFVDIGAYDGKKFSNSLFFEQSMGWTGLCIEPMPTAFAKLAASRKAICENFALADFEGEAEFLEADDLGGENETMFSGLSSSFDPRHVRRIELMTKRQEARRVPVTTLATLLEKHGLYDIDYCSIDVEGGELAILSGFDFERFRIKVLTVENNFADRRIVDAMTEKGYQLYATLAHDCVFKRTDVQPLPRTSVICAVWSGDPERLERLRGHRDNLARQTVPVAPIYVFDSGEQPPDWLDAQGVTVKTPLTVFQAWNVALSLVETPLVMNLNLDDRLAPDAINILEAELSGYGATCAGGEWKVCYSQEETDDVRPCYPADELPFVADWPPQPGTLTRLGSGTRERTTLGPATIWRVNAHIGAPRYPWRFKDGTPIRHLGDAAWWEEMRTNPAFKLIALKRVIGNYYSHPDEQSEFRAPDQAALFRELGVSLL